MLHPRKDYQRIQDPAGKIPEDEPVFLLRAQDSAAAGTVRFWANSNQRMGGDPRLTEMALEHARQMEAWPKKKLADLPVDYDPPAAEPEQPGKIAEAMNYDRQSGPEQPAVEPEPATEPKQQDDKTKSDAAARRRAGYSPY